MIRLTSYVSRTTLFVCALLAISPVAAQVLSESTETFLAGQGVQFVQAVDLDADGDLDVVASQFGQISIFENDGTGALSIGSSFPLASGGPIDVSDINGDTIPDFVSVGYIGPFYTFLSNGIDFDLLESSLVSSPFALRLADLDGDGQPDLITAGFSFATQTSSVATFLGASSGAFFPQSELTLPGIAIDLQVDDFDGDGTIDVAVSTSGGSAISIPPAFPPIASATGTLSVFNSDGLGGLTVGPSVSGPFGQFDLGDVNADGEIDVVAANIDFAPCSDGFWISLGDGSGGFSAPTSQPLGCAIDSVALGDLDLDGRLDLVATDSEANQVYLLLGDDTGTFDLDLQVTVGNGSRPTIGDFDGDGDPDVLTVGANLAFESVLALTRLEGATASGSFLRGDVNQDGGTDISDAVFSLAALFVPGSPSPSCPDSADVNDDGGFDVSDAVFSLAALFVPGATPPPPPSTSCGQDPTPDGLDCPAAPGCP